MASGIALSLDTGEYCFHDALTGFESIATFKWHFGQSVQFVVHGKDGQIFVFILDFDLVVSDAGNYC